MFTITENTSSSGNTYYTVTLLSHDGREHGAGDAATPENAWYWACQDAQVQSDAAAVAAGKAAAKLSCPFPPSCAGADRWTPEEAWAAAG